eukprot:Skav220796  [mRNA]  locus=scaffold150:236840:244810:+ [translate_table: standard]
MLSASSIASCGVPTSKLSNQPLHIVLIHFIAATLGTSPFVLRLLLSPSSFIDAVFGLQLAPHVHVQVLLLPPCTRFAGALLDSIELGDVDGAVACLSQGQCPNHVDELGVPPLYAALNQKNAVIVSALLQAHADVSCRYDFGGSPLHLACRQNLPAAVSHLLRAKADVHARDTEEDTPLHMAAVYGDVACVRLLLDAVADAGARNLLFETPLVSSLTCGVRGAVVAALLDFERPDEWLTILLMHLPFFALTLGTCRFRLFLSCRAMTCQQQFYPPPRALGGFSLLYPDGSLLFDSARLSSLPFPTTREFCGGSCKKHALGSACCGPLRLHQVFDRAPETGCVAVSPPHGSSSGGWRNLPDDCRVHITAFLSSLPDLTIFLQTHRAAWAFLLRAAASSEQLEAGLRPCSCQRLCLNQCLEALVAQGFPLQHSQSSPGMFPHVHRTWECFQSSDECRIVWMAQNRSPRASSVTVEFSPAIKLHARLEFWIGVTTTDHPACVAWPHLFHTQTGFEQRALKLIISQCICSAAKWCTESLATDAFPIPRLDFNRSLRFTFVCGVGCIAVFGPTGHLLARSTDPALAWASAPTAPIRAFASLRSRLILPCPERDHATVVQPILTATRESKLLRPWLHVPAPGVLAIRAPVPPASFFSAGAKRKRSATPNLASNPSVVVTGPASAAVPKSALIIKKPWCDLILSGAKTWEIRGERCHKRERIAIAQAASGLLVGEVDLVDCFPVGDPAITSQYLWAPQNLHKHCVTDPATVPYKNPFAWVLSNPRVYSPPRPFPYKPGCRKWVLLQNNSAASAATEVQGGATSLRGRPLWADAQDSEPSPSAVSPLPAASRAASVPGTTASADSSPLHSPPSEPHANTNLDAARWGAFFLSLLESGLKCGCFLRALQHFMSAPVSDFARSCADLALLAQPWCSFFIAAENHSRPLPFHLCAQLHQHLQCTALLLWELPTKNVFSLQHGCCSPFSGSLKFPCIAYNDANGKFFLVKDFPRVAVPALSDCPAVRDLEVVLFGILPHRLVLPTENLFFCFQSTRMDCVELLSAMASAVSLRACNCLLHTGHFICSRGLSQLCLVLSAAHCVDLIILDSNSCLFHVSSFHELQAISWAAAISRLQAPNCYFFLFNHNTQHFVQALLRVPASTEYPERWLGQPQRTARSACFAPVPLNVANPPLTWRLCNHMLNMFAPCDHDVNPATQPFEPLTESTMQAFPLARGGASVEEENDLLGDRSGNVPCRLLRSTPEDFNRAFETVYRKDPERAKLISRYILADLAQFPYEDLQRTVPRVYEMTESLAQKAGCPFEWAFLLFLPVLGTACSKARLYINEFFLVPPLLWLGLCLDSGANKSGIMTALADIISGFEKHLLHKALEEARKEAETEAEEMYPEQDDQGTKKRKTALSKALAAIHSNKPALFSDEGSLPAIGMQMAQNGPRAIGLYDEGRFLLRALANGEGSGFNASTMSKLFNGSIWKRTVVKDSNRFSMHQTCLCLAMTFHVEEWHEFLLKDGALGMQSRFLMFHSSPRLDKADAVLEPAVYSPRAPRRAGSPALPASLLTEFLAVLTKIDDAHTAQASDFDAAREFIPYFFAADALDYFREHYDAQVLKQEQSYLQDPKLFSHAGKLKSLPWRLALLLHSWGHACSADYDPSAPWSRELSRDVVDTAKSIFEYLSLQSQLLAPGSNLLQILDTHNLRAVAAQKYPFLVTFLATNALPTPASEVGTAIPFVVPDTSFTVWWDALSPENKLYAFLGAHWVLTAATTVMVDQGILVKKLHSQETGKALPRDSAKPHCQNAFLLLKYCQLAALTRPPEKAAPRLRKRPPPQCPASQIGFSNLLHVFKHKHASNLEEYASSSLQLTTSISTVYAADLKATLPTTFEIPRLESCLQVLKIYVEDATPFAHSQKIFNIKSVRATAIHTLATPSSHETPAAPPVRAIPSESQDNADENGQPNAEALDASGGSSCPGRGLSLHDSLLYPASAAMLPVFVLAYHHADAQCRASVAHAMLQQQRLRVFLSASDCEFIFDKLLRHAPHLLAQDCCVPAEIPTACVQPAVRRCGACNGALQTGAARVVPCVRSFAQVENILLLTSCCVRCSRKYFGPWAEFNEGVQRIKLLVEDSPQYFCVTQNLLFATSFLEAVTQLLVNCGGSFRGIVNMLQPKISIKARTLETQLRDAWLQFSLGMFLGKDPAPINYAFARNGMEQWCRQLQQKVLLAFQKRWLLKHRCAKCSRGILGIDGNAKVRTKLCANTDDGVWECEPLHAHCLTGCQNAPIPGRKFCGVHLRDADPVFGSDHFLYLIFAYLATKKALLRHSASAHCRLQLLTAMCPVSRRTRKALEFVLKHAQLDYPVSLISVKKITRSRKYTFRTVLGHIFSLPSALVPTNYQQQYGQTLLEPESRECQTRPPVGHQVHFSEVAQRRACRKQWDKSRAARRSGGVLAAVKECQIVSAVKLVYTHESPTGVYFFLAELFAFLSASVGVDLEETNRKARLQTLRQVMPLVWYDCACTLKRFMLSKKRKRMTKVARTLSQLRLVIDKFHFRKGHTGCKPNGTRPYPKTWPQTHKTRFPNLNDSAAEQSFAFIRKIAVAARRMTPVRGLLFLTLLLHARNLRLERISDERETNRALKKRKFIVQRRAQEAMEAFPFRVAKS